MEIQNGGDTFKWDNMSTPLFKSENMKPTIIPRPKLQFKQDRDYDDDESEIAPVVQENVNVKMNRKSSTDNNSNKSTNTTTTTATTTTTTAAAATAVTYAVDLKDGLYKRSAYLSLDNTTACLLANTKVAMRIVFVREPSVITPDVPLKKGAPPPVAIILEETISELILPLSSLLSVNGSAITGTYNFDNQLLSECVPSYDFSSETAKSTLGDLFIGEESFLSLKIASDNDLAVSTDTYTLFSVLYCFFLFCFLLFCFVSFVLFCFLFV